MPLIVLNFLGIELGTEVNCAMNNSDNNDSYNSLRIYDVPEAPLTTFFIFLM